MCRRNKSGTIENMTLIQTETVESAARRNKETFFALDGCSFDGHEKRSGMAVWLHRSLRVGGLTIPLPDRKVFVPRFLFEGLLPKA